MCIMNDICRHRTVQAWGLHAKTVRVLPSRHERICDMNVATVSELIESIQCLGFNENSPRPIFRGVSRISYPLKPAIGRMTGYSPVKEKSLFRQFKERAILHTGALSWYPTDDWDWLPLAQHYGLATRLLDWTKNPLAAAFFAVENNHDDEEDAVVYGFKPNRLISKEICREQNISPFNLPSDIPLVVLVPAHFSPRIAVQESLFILFNDPYSNLSSQDMVQFVIKHDVRKALRMELYRIGVHRASLFPDMDNLCKHLNDYWSILGGKNA